MEENKMQSLAIPIAIILGFGLIAAAIFISGTPSSNTDQTGTTGDGVEQQQQQEEQGSIDSINPVTENDHILGDPNAPIMIVEYSDFDCPFCKQFHETMNQVMARYGESGEVAWVYRHFPLEQLHPNAPLLAQASECVAELGGNESFWTFSDLVFEERETNDLTDLENLPGFVETAGVDSTEYEACMDSGETRANVEEDFSNAITIGGRGTPYSIIMVGDQMGVINGAQPFTTVSGIIEDLLGQIEGGELDPHATAETDETTTE